MLEYDKNEGLALINSNKILFVLNKRGNRYIPYDPQIKRLGGLYFYIKDIVGDYHKLGEYKSLELTPENFNSTFLTSNSRLEVLTINKGEVPK